MQLYPAIDMKNGKCVRLRQGAFKDITVYSEHPEEIAALWQEKGAPFFVHFAEFLIFLKTGGIFWRFSRYL